MTGNWSRFNPMHLWPPGWPYHLPKIRPLKNQLLIFRPCDTLWKRNIKSWIPDSSERGHPGICWRCKCPIFEMETLMKYNNAGISTDPHYNFAKFSDKWVSYTVLWINILFSNSDTPKDGSTFYFTETVIIVFGGSV